MAEFENDEQLKEQLKLTKLSYSFYWKNDHGDQIIYQYNRSDGSPTGKKAFLIEKLEITTNEQRQIKENQFVMYSAFDFSPYLYELSE